jgi:hypothetical protein
VEAYFEYGTTRGIYDRREPTTSPVPGGAVNQKVSASLEGLDRTQTYYYRLVATPEGGAPVPSPEGIFVLTNNAPVAREDVQIIDGRTPTKISVLANDTDRDGDPLYIVKAKQGKHGRVAVTGKLRTGHRTRRARASLAPTSFPTRSPMARKERPQRWSRSVVRGRRRPVCGAG